MNFPVKDLSGQRFDRWLVLGRAPNNKDNDSMWFCRCNCGTERIVRGVTLRNSESRSCGCYQKECAKALKVLPDGEGSFRQLYRTYKNWAKVDCREFNMSPEEFRELTQGNCFYCGIAPSQVIQRKFGTPYVYNGVDRLDSKLGYTKHNCVPCCGTHNKMKLDMSVAEFLEACRSVVRFHPEK